MTYLPCISTYPVRTVFLIASVCMPLIVWENAWYIVARKFVSFQRNWIILSHSIYDVEAFWFR